LSIILCSVSLTGTIYSKIRPPRMCTTPLDGRTVVMYDNLHCGHRG